MTAPIGAVVSLYVDLVESVAVGDQIRTGTGRSYEVLAVRVQQRGKAAGRHHLRCIVIDPSDRVNCSGLIQTQHHNVLCLMCGERGQTCGRRLHTIRWYKREAKR